MKKAYVIVAIAGICAAALMAVFIGIVGIAGIRTIDNGYYESSEYYAQAMPELAKIVEYTQRFKTRMYALAVSANDEAAYQASEADVNFLVLDFEMYLESYQQKIVNYEVIQRFDEAKEAYYNEYKPMLMEMLVSAGAGADYEELLPLVYSSNGVMNIIADNFDACMEITALAEQEAKYANNRTANTLVIVIIIVIVIAVITSLVFIIVVAVGSRLEKPSLKNTFPAYTVFAAYPIDQSNQTCHTNATHMIYPVNPVQPPNEQRKPQE